MQPHALPQVRADATAPQGRDASPAPLRPLRWQDARRKDRARVRQEHDGAGVRMISLHIPAPCKAINSNDRLHHAVRANRTRLWREAAAVRSAAAGLEQYDHAHVTAVCHFTDKRRRDAGNWYPTAKAALDGCVDAGLLPDD